MKDSNPYRVLIVDDSLTIRMQIKDQLEKHGFLVLLAKNGLQCLELLEAKQPDIILLDIIMPDMEGTEVCQIIKKDKRFRHIPILILTTESDIQNKIKGLNAGADDYLTKPFEMEELKARLASILRNKELLKKLQFEINMHKRTQDSLRKTKEEAERATIAKSAFLANMSHEIRTPMHAVLSALDLLKDSSLPKKQQKLVSIAHHAADALLNILNDILDLSKMEAGKLELNTVSFNLRELISNSLEIYKIRAQEKNIDIKIQYSSSIPQHFLADSTRIRQVIINLIGNAIKFTEEGYVLLKVDCTGTQNNLAHLRFEINDTGIGISEKNIVCIFGPFEQVDNSDTRKFGGTGLGLAICKKIIHIMKGELGVNSELGKGSTFWFTLSLPMTDENEKKIHMQSLPDAIHALVVDDDRVCQMLSKKLLEKLHCKVDVATSGEKAIEMLQNTSCDIIFMDVQMPGMGGKETTKHLRQSGITTIIIAATAGAMPEERELCLQAGMNDFIAKPFKKDDLHKMIEKWLQRNNS